jgi:spore germination cell wall hydrolase CwlJ-like protein
VSKNHATLNPHLALFDHREVTCLAKAVYHEARGEVLAGQYAVAKTVVNRAVSSQFPKTICGVVYQPHQFTGIQRLRVKDKQSYAKALDIAYNVLNMRGNYKFPALYFHTKQVSPGWKRKRLAIIGNHIFYT